MEKLSIINEKLIDCEIHDVCMHFVGFFHLDVFRFCSCSEISKNWLYKLCSVVIKFILNKLLYVLKGVRELIKILLRGARH